MKYNSMKTSTFLISVSFAALLLCLSSCFDDLNTVPLDDELTTADAVFENEEAYLAVLAKCYAGLAVTGQSGPAGNGDIGGIDEGFSSYLRLYWKMQELPTEEAVIGWNDQTIADFHELDWTASDGFIAAMYYRIFYQVSVTNELLRQTTPELLDSRGVSAATRAEIPSYRAEARFLRALSYYHALDLFRNVPFVTEDDAVGAFFPEQRDADFIFDFIESELLDIEDEIAAVGTSDYGRADQGAVWTLLSQLYLNAETHIGQDRYADAAAYSERVIESGAYSLEPAYNHLFLADNDRSQEIIFPITFDGLNTRTWGGTTFIIRASIGGVLDAEEFGVVNGWAGLRTTPQLVNQFDLESAGGIVSDFNPGGTAGYKKLYVPGDYNDYQYDDVSTSISSAADDGVYEGIKVFPEDNSTFLITRIPANALVLGDNEGDGILESNGGAITVPDAGIYYLTVDLNDNSYSLQRISSVELEGSSVVGGNIELVYQEDQDLWYTAYDGQAGDLSVRLRSDEGDIVLGDADTDNILTQGSAPASLDAIGPAEIFVRLGQRDFTYRLGSTSFDRRALFSTEGQSLEIATIPDYNQGYAVSKFRNVTSDGSPGSNMEHADTDFPLMRLGEVYLTAAEALLRSGQDRAKATDYFNAVRERTYQGPGGNISQDELNLDLLLDERARELYWEGYRRSDLVRYGLLTSSEYLWAWKGGVPEGRGASEFRRVYPIPSADINANPNLEQNEGY